MIWKPRTFFLVGVMALQVLGWPQASEAFPAMSAKTLGKMLDWAIDSVDDLYRWWVRSDVPLPKKRIPAPKPLAAGTRRVPCPLSKSQIKDLADLPVAEAGKRLGRMNLSLPELEQVYLRILATQKKISSAQADDLLHHLGGVEGFVSTLRKASSSNSAQAAGHLFELETARAAKKQGYTVLAIGRKYADPAKKGLTDLDLFFEKNGKKYFVEAKSYEDVSWSSLPNFRADMDSLQAASDLFGSGEKVFIIRNKPTDDRILRALNEAARSRNVVLVFGSPENVLNLI